MLAVFGVVAAIAAAQPAAATAETVWAVGDGATATGPAGGMEDDMLGDFIASELPFDRFLYLGDVYQTGTLSEFFTNYDPAFGAFRDISSPTPGDNEWPNVASGYDPYWGTLAPRTSSGGRYYSFDLGDWHVISLNSNQSTSATSTQLSWLRDDLARAEYNGTCTIAMIHEPRYFASEATGSGDTYGIEPLWAALEGHAVAVLSGHIHNYQRLVPEGGITQFVVGTGGRQNRALEADPTGQVASSSTRTGALRLDLNPGSAEYDFFGLDRTRLDSGTLACQPHASTPKPPPPASPKPPPPPPPAPSPAPAPTPAPATAEAPVFRSPVATITAPASLARARISLGRQSRLSSRRGFTVVGRSQGARRAIRLSLIRRVGRRCEAFDGRRFRRASCRARAVLVASGRERFSYRFRRPLPRGTYLLSARAVDGLGMSAWASRRLTVR